MLALDLYFHHQEFINVLIYLFILFFIVFISLTVIVDDICNKLFLPITGEVEDNRTSERWKMGNGAHFLLNGFLLFRIYEVSQCWCLVKTIMITCTVIQCGNIQWVLGLVIKTKAPQNVIFVYLVQRTQSMKYPWYYEPGSRHTILEMAE